MDRLRQRSRAGHHPDTIDDFNSCFLDKLLELPLSCAPWKSSQHSSTNVDLRQILPDNGEYGSDVLLCYDTKRRQSGSLMVHTFLV